MNDIKIESGWKEILREEFEKGYFQNLIQFLKREKSEGKIIYPPGPLIFNAFNTTAFKDVKVVILGQDPYHGPGEAMGLCFSVPRGIKKPPSLVNIFKELNRSFGYPVPNNGDLSPWARQGVLLLNASLTVLHKQANSHKDFGWHPFTDEVIRKLSELKENLVFMLWGNFAKSKKVLIDSSKHCILESPHPSPLAGGGFIGNNHFKTANHYLTSHGIREINWQIID